jgi:hypothetical protein
MYRSVPLFTGPKKVSISRTQPPPTCPRNVCASIKSKKHYVRGRINHKSINSYYVPERFFMYATVSCGFLVSFVI